MPITSLSFTNVGPFDEVEFTFDPQVNIFTGPNNSEIVGVVGTGRCCGLSLRLPRETVETRKELFV